MQRLTNDASSQERCREQAADWLLRLEAEPECMGQFEAWLLASNEHAQAWAQVSQAWSCLGGLATIQPEQAPSADVTPISAPAKPPVIGRRRWAPRLAAAACIFGVAVLVQSSLPQRLLADLSTGSGEVRQLQLDDGSLLTLAPNSAVDIDFKAGRRQIKLLSGEGFFQVAHDASRPFVIAAAGIDVRVLGTQFSVRLEPSRLSVAVREGTVGVSSATPGQTLDQRLTVGQQLQIDRQSGALAHSQIAPTEVAAWQSGKVFFDNASVAEVIEELRRFHQGWIVIANPQLAEQRVTGLYDLHDTQRALQALASPFEAEVLTLSPLLMVLK